MGRAQHYPLILAKKRVLQAIRDPESGDALALKFLERRQRDRYSPKIIEEHTSEVALGYGEIESVSNATYARGGEVSFLLNCESGMKMAKKKAKKKDQSAGATVSVRPGGAPSHKTLKNNVVHVFVDDQNLFLGIVNDQRGASYRLDFGLLLTEASKDSAGNPRPVKSAYIAGVIPNDDTFWGIAENKGFKVNRGYLGAGGRSKQDDAYLITDIMETLYEQDGPSTIVLVAGDADYVPPLKKTLAKGWRNEVAYIARGLSTALEPVVHEFRTMSSHAIELH